MDTEVQMSDAAKTEVLLRKFYANQSTLRGYVFSATRNYHATEEILQSTAIVVAQKASVFDIERAEAPWFMGIAKNHIQRWYRTNGRDSRNISLDLLDRVIPDSETFEEDAVASRHEALATCINRLPEKQKSIVSLRYMENIECQGIANRLDRSVQSIYSLLKRLKIELRKCVESKLKNEEATI